MQQSLISSSIAGTIAKQRAYLVLSLVELLFVDQRGDLSGSIRRGAGDAGACFARPNFFQNLDAPGSESVPSQPRPFAGRGCIAAWTELKASGSLLAFASGAQSARSKYPPPATGKSRQKPSPPELVQLARNQPPAAAIAISGHSVSQSPPAVLARARIAPVRQNSPAAPSPIGHRSNFEGHGRPSRNV